MKEKIAKNQKLLKNIVLVFVDILSVILASFLAIYVRYDFKFNAIDAKFLDSLFIFLPINIVMAVMFYYVFRLYNSMWKYASIIELINIIEAETAVFIVVVGEMILGGFRVPRSFPFMYVVFLTVITFVIRFYYRIANSFKSFLVKDNAGIKTMIIGAGEAATVLLKEIKNSQFTNYDVKCAIDDDVNKHGKFVSGIKVVGGRDKIKYFVEKYGIEEIIIAMPSVDKKVISEILEISKETNCKLKKIPGIYQLVNGNVSVNDIKDVEIDDLLGREQIKVNLDEIMDYVSNRTVLVTGGGGSIGSELCRQLAAHKPARLIIVDIYENNAYDIQQELKTKYPKLNLIVLIASVRNTHRINEIFKEYKPEVVYHAAAHKHVPLMEDSPNEAIKNNVFGTYKTALAAAANGTKKFVLISTDKAVNPTNIMGASKRICEMIIQNMNRRCSGTNFVAVRFGNVLGSNGSVIPLFKKQIKAGGPVTVTHPEIIRYFMTISEAVSLVLQAGAYAKGGEIFVLDMGEPVKILDLAKNLIRLSGYTEDEIAIEFTGLRPGEKLYEELLMSEEGLEDTENKLIHIGKPIVFDEKKFENNLKDLKEYCENDSADIRECVSRIVDTYSFKK